VLLNVGDFIMKNCGLSFVFLCTYLFSGAVLADGVLDGRFGNTDIGGVVFVMTNDPNGNEIVVYERNRRGKLHPIRQAFRSTGGIGAGQNAPVDPLGSQNSLLYDGKHDMLFAVNAGDNSVTAFKVRLGFWLRRTDIVSSGGDIPVSVAVIDDLLYVLNAGGSGSVATFDIGSTGVLTPLGALDLGQSNETSIPFDNIAAPGQVGVDALKRRLIVTNAGGNELLLADLDNTGVPIGELVSTPDPGMGPFSFGVTPFGNVLVAEAASGSVSSFEPPLSAGPLDVAAGVVATGQAATCWIVIHPAGFAYVSNTESNTLSVFSYSRTSDLELVSAVAAMTGGGPTDLTLAGNGRFIYSLNAGTGDISGFEIDANDGSLAPVETQTGLPASAGIQGIAARDF
jgi:6-phosphogluconolactonase (cycloisomerase 2 family)